MDPTAERLIGSLRASGYPADKRGGLAQIPRRLRYRAWHIREKIGTLVYGRGTDTETCFVAPEHFSPDLVWYVPSGWWYLRRALRAIDVSPDDVFVDFGAGKGRVVLHAARLPFRRVVGVEISPILADVARRNVELARRRLKCAEVEIVTADAAEFAVPDDMTVAYLCHPFSGETFRRVLGQIVASLRRAPRRLQVVYAVSVNSDDILATGCFRMVSTKRIRDGGLPQTLAVYEARGGLAEGPAARR